eukprot:comp18153_c0_seq2/m.18917 comp18153_c0_seq2/g.18917  ORF comp18153_c0_seq2/g.18917 comp18153_c0_seq2/m.18917 type:complete len:316 (-) comp18153_c0_seq2:513-1460(-)
MCWRGRGERERGGCSGNDRRVQKPEPPRVSAVWRYERCYKCGVAYAEGHVFAAHSSKCTGDIVTSPPPTGTDQSDSILLSTVSVFHNFLTPEEGVEVVKAIDSSPWVISQSGRRKQDYGPLVNFKKRKMKWGNYSGLPSYAQVIAERMKTFIVMADFVPVELGNLEYDPTRGSCNDPHIDDQWAWGERIVTLSLLSDSVMTFSRIITLPTNGSAPLNGATSCDSPNGDSSSSDCAESRVQILVRVPLPAGALLVSQGEARHQWAHAILRDDVTTRRLSATFRELAPDFLPGGPQEEMGREMLKIALEYRGVVCGS